jgi:hypothetical protein
MKVGAATEWNCKWRKLRHQWPAEGLNVRMHCELCCSWNKETLVFVLDAANAEVHLKPGMSRTFFDKGP